MNVAKLLKLVAYMAFVAIGVSACSTGTILYNPREFDTVNYQKNVDNAVDAADILNDFGLNESNTALSPSDLSTLIQADLYYNQGSYTRAYPLYITLANQYKNPRIIYKAIICIEHIGTTDTQMQELHHLVRMFVDAAPDSKLAKLFQIKLALRNNDVSAAKDNLNTLIRGNETSARAIFLFISSILGSDLTNTNAATLNSFADYVVDKYDVYPEANLMAAIGYAAANNIAALNQRIQYIYAHYSNWDVPAYWSADVLSTNNHRNELIQVVEPIIQMQANPSLAIQNMYIAALIAANQLPRAKKYLESKLYMAPHDNNTLINLGVISAKMGNYNAAANYLKQAKTPSSTQDDVLSMSAASFFDYAGNINAAIEYYQKVSNPHLVFLRDIMMVNDYLVQKNYAAVDKILNQLATAEKLDPLHTLLFKSEYYINAHEYGQAYQVLQERENYYRKDKSYTYQYAVASAMTHRTNQAVRLYKTYIKMSPDQAYGYNDLAYLYADQTTQYNLAKKYAYIAYKLSPTDPTVLDTVGWVNFKFGDYKQALAYIKTSFDATHDPDAAQHLAQVYTALNQPELARAVTNTPPRVTLHLALKQHLANKMLGLLSVSQYGKWIEKEQSTESGIQKTVYRGQKAESSNAL